MTDHARCCECRSGTPHSWWKGKVTTRTYAMMLASHPVCAQRKRRYMSTQRLVDKGSQHFIVAKEIKTTKQNVVFPYSEVREMN